MPRGDTATIIEHLTNDQCSWELKVAGGFKKALGRLPLFERTTMSKNLYVGNLAFETTSDDLREMFAAFGTVTSASVVTDRDTGRSRGFGFVEMAHGSEKAIETLNGSDVGGRQLTVNEAKPRESRGGSPRGRRF